MRWHSMFCEMSSMHASWFATCKACRLWYLYACIMWWYVSNGLLTNSQPCLPAAALPSSWWTQMCLRYGHKQKFLLNVGTRAHLVAVRVNYKVLCSEVGLPFVVCNWIFSLQFVQQAPECNVNLHSLVCPQGALPGSSRCLSRAHPQQCVDLLSAVCCAERLEITML